MKRKIQKNKSLAKLYPHLANEWHPTKNKDITPDDITPGIALKAWWRCSKNHEWQAAVYSRKTGNGCPYCSGRKVNQENCLSAKNPELVQEWHWKKNKPLTPDNVTSNSSKKVWWKCRKGHVWQADIQARNKGSGCPYCVGRRGSKEYNFKKYYPLIAEEWHPTKNTNLTPENITPHSHRKVWWQCKKGHEWQTVVRNRIRGDKCPFCSGKKVCADNCLAVVKPELAQEWHPTKNGDLTPKDVTPHYCRKVWWVCKKGHDWQVAVNVRNKGIGCPYCRGLYASKDNCLDLLTPVLTSEWHPVKNGNLTPKDVTVRSGKKVWWLCQNGHEWQALISNRTAGNGCPYCRGFYVCIDNCLATLEPDVAKEWHPSLNGKLTPYDVTSRSAKKVWWQCAYGHEWQSIVSNRTGKYARGCPVCYRELKKKGYYNR